MKQHIAFATVIAAALSVGVAAQQTSPQDRNDKEVTVVGCLQSASGSTAGTTGTTGTMSGDQFILTNATVQPSSGAMGAPDQPTTPPTTEPYPPTNPPTTPPTTEPSEPTGTSGSMAGKTFKLTDTQDDNLQQYVNQKVEIKGEIQKKDESGAMTNPPSTNPPESASASAQQSLKVSSVRSISPNCSGSQK